jgi:hypothetical protein
MVRTSKPEHSDNPFPLRFCPGIGPAPRIPRSSDPDLRHASPTLAAFARTTTRKTDTVEF